MRTNDIIIQHDKGGHFLCGIAYFEGKIKRLNDDLRLIYNENPELGKAKALHEIQIAEASKKRLWDGYKRHMTKILSNE
jgi:hypothetical protein